MHVLVVGGTGFIGSHVVRELASRGAGVHVFHRGNTHADLPGSVAYLHGDREDLTALSEALRPLRPDVVLDMIALTEAHARATLQICGAASGRVVAISSMDVYRAFDVIHSPDAGPPLQPVPIDEDGELRANLYPARQASEDPRTADRPQEYEKILVERVLREQSVVPATLLRLPIVYGPGDTVRRRTLPYVKRMSDDRPAILMTRGLSRWVVSRGYVENVAHAIAEAIMNERAANRTYNVADAAILSEQQWAQKLADVAGWRGRIVEVPEGSVPPGVQFEGNFAQHLLLDTSRIREELGYYEPVALDEALRRTIAWELANPPAVLQRDAFPYDAEDALLANLDRVRAPHLTGDSSLDG